MGSTYALRRGAALCAILVLLAAGAPAHGSAPIEPRAYGAAQAPVGSGMPVAAPGRQSGDAERPGPLARSRSNAGLPSPAVVRACMASISRMAGCLGTAVYATCGSSFTRFLSCSGRAYNAYQTTQKIQAFRAAPSCPTILSDVLADYLCTSRVPQAPRSVWAIVDNNGYPLTTRTGPSTFYPTYGTYPYGRWLPVVCVARFGQVMVLDGQSSAYWSRLSNGLFVPWIGLRAPTSETVPWC